jgi:hypothetical protein
MMTWKITHYRRESCIMLVGWERMWKLCAKRITVAMSAAVYADETGGHLGSRANALSASNRPPEPDVPRCEKIVHTAVRRAIFSTQVWIYRCYADIYGGNEAISKNWHWLCWAVWSKCKWKQIWISDDWSFFRYIEASAVPQANVKCSYWLFAWEKIILYSCPFGIVLDRSQFLSALMKAMLKNCDILMYTAPCHQSTIKRNNGTC